MPPCRVSRVPASARFAHTGAALLFCLAACFPAGALPRVIGPGGALPRFVMSPVSSPVSDPVSGVRGLGVVAPLNDAETLPRSPTGHAGADVGEAAAAAAAQAVAGGKVLAVRRSDGAYEVTLLLDSGQVRVLRVDAVSGRVVGG